MKTQISARLSANLFPSMHRILTAWEHGTLAQTILLSGPPGIGKKQMAIELARILSCQSDIARPCGHCFSCKLLDKTPNQGENPWLWLVPLKGSTDKSKKEERAEKTAEIAKQIIINPFTDPYESGSTHTIAAVRDLLLQFQYHETQTRVVLITEAELMNESTSNALLKTLEEAPDNTYFILTCSKPSQLLPTIRSRCFQVPVHALEFADFKQKLQNLNVDMSEEQETLLFAMSEGSWGQALTLIEKNLDTQRDLCFEFLDCILAKQFHVLQKWIQKSGIGSNQNLLTEFLEILYLLAGDLISVQVGVLPRNRDQVEKLKKYEACCPKDLGLQVLQLIQKGLDRSGRHIAPQINLSLVYLDWEALT